MSERFPFITDISDRPALTPAERREAIGPFFRGAGHVLFQYEGGEERTEGTSHPDAVTLNLYNAR
jgi:hypothetical protein